MQLGVKCVPTTANPTALTRRIAHDQRIIGHVAGDHGSSRHQSAAPHCDTANNNGIGPKRGPFPHQGGAGLIHFFNVGAWVEYIGKDHAWPAKDIILKCHMAVNADVILYFAIVAHARAAVYKDILADITAFSDDGALPDMAKMPNMRSSTYLRTCVNAGCLVGEVVHVFLTIGSARALAPVYA